MATFYVGAHSVLKGRNGEVTNTYTGKVGVYSNWDLMNTSHVLDGAPDNHHVPGTGYSPHGINLTRMFRGLSDQNAKNSLKDPGLGARQDSYYFRQKPLEWKGVTSGKAFRGNFGHVSDDTRPYAMWTNFKFHGVTASQILATAKVGHGARAYGAGAAFFGPFKPYEFHGVNTFNSNPMSRAGHGIYASSVVADKMPADYGQIPATRATTEHYGFEHVQEWFGVPAAKAL